MRNVWRRAVGWSTVACLLKKISALSPMPDDKALLNDETALADRYDALIEEIGQALTQETLGPAEEEELVTVLADSFGLGGGMGIYWGTLHLIERQPPSIMYLIIRDRVVHSLPGTRYWCSFILGRRRHIDDLPLFLALLNDEIPEVREQALHAIVMLSRATSVHHVLPSICLLLEDIDSGVRRAAQQAVASIDA